MANKIESPMPGNILQIKVSVGDKVTENQVICILEAMKMETDIVTPWAGTITGVHIKESDVLDTGALMFTVE